MMTPLRQRRMEEMQIRNYSSNTTSNCVSHVAQFAKHFGKSPYLLGPEEVGEHEEFLL